MQLPLQYYRRRIVVELFALLLAPFLGPDGLLGISSRILPAVEGIAAVELSLSNDNGESPA